MRGSVDNNSDRCIEALRANRVARAEPRSASDGLFAN
jgi:hypothetical protein